MDNKRRNAYDTAFKLKAISLRWDCESDNEETEVSDEVLRLFNSDTVETVTDHRTQMQGLFKVKLFINNKQVEDL